MAEKTIQRQGQRRGYKCAFKENESDSDEGGH